MDDSKSNVRKAVRDHCQLIQRSSIIWTEKEYPNRNECGAHHIIDWSEPRFRLAGIFKFLKVGISISTSLPINPH